MSEEQFYVANIDLAISEDEMRDLFSEFGDVTHIERIIHPSTGNPRENANIKIVFPEGEDIPAATWRVLETMNGKLVNGKPIYVIYSHIPETTPTDESRALVKKIAIQLNERDRTPMAQILRMVHICGAPFVNAIVEETERIEADGGMLTNDGSRRRTKGGVFFYLARRRLPVRFQRAIFQFTKQKPADKNQNNNNKAKAQQRNKGKGDRPQGKSKPQGQAQAGNKATGKPQKGKPAGQGAGKPQPKDRAAKAGPGQRPKTGGDGGPKAAPSQAKRRSTASPEKLEVARRQLTDLRAKQQVAQQRLEELKALPQSERKSGLFSATREVVNIQKQISNLLRQYPELEE
ncbi:MAG: hypothetical protein ACLFTK_12220 [Anaerolineales bacterium]